MDRLAVSHVPLTFGLDHCRWKREFYLPVEHSSLVVRLLMRIIALKGRKFLPEKFRLFRAHMGNERLGF